MRLPLLAALLAALALAPAAQARLIDEQPTGPAVIQNLSSPDAQDANAAQHAQTLQDIVKQHRAHAAALAQERYYSSYGPAQKPAPADEDSPLLSIVLGLGLTVVAASAVSMAVRSRRRVRVAV
jgi:hypothetical protein